MRFIDGIKFGASFYLGHLIVSALVEILSDPKAFKKEVERRIAQEEPQKNEKKIIGFHM